MGKQLSLGEGTQRSYTAEQQAIQKALAENDQLIEGFLSQRMREKQECAQARHQRRKPDNSTRLFTDEPIVEPVQTQISLF